MRPEMVQADVALFRALGDYFTGISQILRAELADSESDGLKEAAKVFRKGLTEIESVRDNEERILDLAQPIESSAYFVRRHEVASQNTAALAAGFEGMIRDLEDGYYPAAACVSMSRTLTRMMANFEQDARIEGVVGRVERLAPDGSDPGSD